jgi:peptidyl-prolyl cis-trans isomerase A (cyclophilin A)/peptidyl-prolyl cis-trans isomerase B (cyclophilin B)
MWWKPTSFFLCGSLALLLAAGCSPGTGMSGNPPLPDDAPRVVIETDYGDVVVGLYEERSPITVANFLEYVDAGFYDGTAFHRVIPGFMIQGGGYVPRGGQRFESKERRAAIALESDNGLRNVRGTLSMARGGMPDTATSEFFINLVDNQRLDRLGDVNLGYAVFGVVVEGMDVVDEIAAVETVASPDFASMGERAAPVEDVVIRSIRRVE